MTKLHRVLYKLVLPQLFARKSPERIPRSGEAGERVNCFSVFIDDKDESPFFIAESFSGTVLKGKKLDGSAFTLNAEIDLAKTEANRLRVVHYYGLSEVRYRGIQDIAFTWAFPFVYLKIHFSRIKDKIAQIIFNRRNLQALERIRLLRLIVDLHSENENPISAFNVMTTINSMRWVLHPEGDVQMRKINLYLASLVDSGDLSNKNNRYEVTGRAIGTIERFEEEERRHTENARIQWAMLGLTFVMALLTVVQAGLIKLPTLIDLSK